MEETHTHTRMHTVYVSFSLTHVQTCREKLVHGHTYRTRPTHTHMQRGLGSSEDGLGG